MEKHCESWNEMKAQKRIAFKRFILIKSLRAFAFLLFIVVTFVLIIIYGD